MGQLKVNPHVRHVSIDGRVVLLDFRTEGYSVLDPVASAMWQMAAEGRSRDDTLAALAEQFEVEEARLERDYEAFLDKCRGEGLLCESTAQVEEDECGDAHGPAFRPWRRGPLALRAWGTLLVTSRLLKRSGFAETYRRFVRLSVESATCGGGELQPTLTRGVRAFARAENFFLLRRAPKDCLPRSLSLFGFLRSLGVPVEHRIGVQMLPFLAHAWVQHGERVVHDDPQNPRRFTTIACIHVNP
jgi:hypothetical protein